MSTASQTTGQLTRSTTAAAAAGGSHTRLLDDVFQRLKDERRDERQVHVAMDDLFLGLYLERRDMSERQWQAYIETCRRHPIADLLNQDPCTRRAYTKPRGYSGDAELLDFLYGSEERWLPPESTTLGQWIFNYMMLAPAAEGVRARRAFAAALIDRLAEEVRKPEILSIGAGHLREANLSAVVKRKRFGRFVALDGDRLSLEEVQKCYGWHGIETVMASIRRLITGKVQLGYFDLVYATGLLDYVGPAAARRLVSTMFRMLRPGGRLVVANFLPGIRDSGYMEAFMDWYLIYRTRQEMVDITMEVPQKEIRDIRLFAEENQNIIFTKVRRN
jgi:SAM-dependent methyltransferase